MKNFRSLVSETLKIYGEKKTIWSILLICLICVLIISLICGFLLQGIRTAFKNVEPLQLSLWTYLLFGVLIIVGGLGGLFLTLLMIVSAMKPVQTQLKDIFREAWLKLGQGLGVFVLSMLFVALGTIFFIVPGIIIGVFLAFSLYVCVIENKKGMDALKRSWNLVKGNWWQVFGRLLLLGIIANVIILLLNAVPALTYGVLSLVFQLLFIPFNVIFNYLMYLDLKKISENKVQTEPITSTNG